MAKLEGRESQILGERDHKLETARRQRQGRGLEAFARLSDRTGDSSNGSVKLIWPSEREALAPRCRNRLHNGA